MSPTDPVIEADEESFPASDAPTFSTAHAGPPAKQALHLLIGLPPGDPDVDSHRAALARFGSLVVLTFADAAGDDFARALPAADIVVAQDLTDEQRARAGRLRWLSPVETAEVFADNLERFLSGQPG